MEQLEKVLEILKNYLKEAEKKHSTDIYSFINLDEDAIEKFSGDWSKKEIENYQYVFERASVLNNAKKIIEEEMYALNITNKDSLSGKE